jgi:hypothetical protein
MTNPVLKLEKLPELYNAAKELVEYEKELLGIGLPVDPQVYFAILNKVERLVKECESK